MTGSEDGLLRLDRHVEHNSDETVVVASNLEAKRVGEPGDSSPGSFPGLNFMVRQRVGQPMPVCRLPVRRWKPLERKVPADVVTDPCQGVHHRLPVTSRPGYPDQRARFVGADGTWPVDPEQIAPVGLR